MERVWNQQFLDLKQSKIIQGICAIGIIFHHMAQKTCAPWIESQYIVHGLDGFLNLGFLFVGVFFFFSGFGLYKSYKTKENYLYNFLRKHLTPIIAMLLVTDFLFYAVGQTTSPYTWYIFTIIYLYISFALSFKIKNKEWLSISVLSVLVILYILFCDFMAAGIWWYNTVGLFLAGLLFAKFELNLTDFLKKRFISVAIVTVVIFAVTFFFSVRLNNSYLKISSEAIFTLMRWLVVILHFLASFFFVILVLLINLKHELKCKFFAFAGTMTLELYLIHGLFVQMFSYNFVNGQHESVFYVRNLFFYIIIVLILSFLAAWCLMKLRKITLALIKKNDKIFAVFTRDNKKAANILLIIFIALTLILVITEQIDKKNRKPKALAYSEENIQFAQVDDKKMAAYIVTPEEDAKGILVVVRGKYDPCSTITMKNLGDTFGKEYKVVLLDLLGSGFSDNTRKERSIENITGEIHTAIKSLGIEGPYMIMSEYFSSLQALYYVNQYPGEVSTVLNVDGMTFAEWKNTLERNNSSPLQEKRRTRASCFVTTVLVRIGQYLGYKKLLWPIVEELYQKSVAQKDMDVAYELFFKNLYSPEVIDEINHEYKNLLLCENLTYPEDVRVVDFISNRKKYKAEAIGVDLKSLNLCQNPENHIVVDIVDSLRCLCFSPEILLKWCPEEKSEKMHK